MSDMHWEPWQISELHAEGYEVVAVHREGVLELVLRDLCGEEPEWEPYRDRAEDLLDWYRPEIHSWLSLSCPACWQRPALVPGGCCTTCQAAADEASVVDVRGDPTPHAMVLGGFSLCGIAEKEPRPAAERPLCQRCTRALARRVEERGRAVEARRG